ncbi:hypothetical protein NE237_008549 [Protea cynaroides]|uniref:Uncharacterized protein n=1 Tax=Protea cynaroides TaxID=273540 RepID=A0A9Q0KWY5_9MAGN|nr:hypothetical protein NE237_008549 [Protea cynaroides]
MVPHSGNELLGVGRTSESRSSDPAAVPVTSSMIQWPGNYNSSVRNVLPDKVCGFDLMMEESVPSTQTRNALLLLPPVDEQSRIFDARVSGVSDEPAQDASHRHASVVSADGLLRPIKVLEELGRVVQGSVTMNASAGLNNLVRVSEVRQGSLGFGELDLDMTATSTRHDSIIFVDGFQSSIRLLEGSERVVHRSVANSPVRVYKVLVHVSRMLAPAAMNSSVRVSDGMMFGSAAMVPTAMNNPSRVSEGLLHGSAVNTSAVINIPAGARMIDERRPVVVYNRSEVGHGNSRVSGSSAGHRVERGVDVPSHALPGVLSSDPMMMEANLLGQGPAVGSHGASSMSTMNASGNQGGVCRRGGKKRGRWTWKEKGKLTVVADHDLAGFSSSGPENAVASGGN